VRYASRPYVFTASLPPATIAATRAALRKLPTPLTSGNGCATNADRLHAGLTALGFRLGQPANAVVAVLINDKLDALRFWTIC